jgi:hypothetical protein
MASAEDWLANATTDEILSILEAIHSCASLKSVFIFVLWDLRVSSGVHKRLADELVDLTGGEPEEDRVRVHEVSILT